MDARGIIDSIGDIYDRFEIPPNLQMHMFRAAALAELVCDNWKGPRINKADIISVSLIHDLGNIVKFDLETPAVLKLYYDQTEEAIGKLREVRGRTIAKYGTDDHAATQMMAKELDINKRLMYLLTYGGHAFTDTEIIVPDDWDVKIYAYADFRIGPFGIMPLKDRFEEFRRRQEIRIERGAKNWSYEHIDAIVAAGFALEKELQANVSLRLNQINDSSVQPYLDKYL